MTLGPYAAAATTYLGKGWAPIPLPPREKQPPPTGWTGYDAPYPSGADVAEWADSNGSGNIALRLPQNVIGIDVDAYGAKMGATTLAEAEMTLGPLPPTYRSTSRTDGTSAIRVYRVRLGSRVWADVVGADVEVIHYGHRYMVVAPSLHRDTGAPYVWYSPDNVQCSAPAIDQIPYLPSMWEDFLDQGDISTRATKAAVTVASAAALLSSYPNGPMCQVLQGEVARAGTALATSGSRHDTVRGIIASVVRAGERGHNGSAEALLEIHEIWLKALQFGEKRVPDPGEFERLVAGAVAIVVDDPTAPADVRCCSAPMAAFEFIPPVGFWDARPELAVIKEAAQASMAAPWAVLLAVLVRVTCAVSPRVVLPGAPELIGGECSLNLFVGLVGQAGGGKGAAEAVAAKTVVLPEIYVASVGSGEGIGHTYAHRVKGLLITDRTSALFSVPEVDTLTALGNRQGATLMPQIRSAYMGEQLGFGTADVSKRIRLEPHTYRMGLILGIQPDRAESLMLDAAGGTPQRFLFGSVVDREAPDPDSLPAMPAAWRWELYDRHLIMPWTNTYVKVCDAVTFEVKRNRYLQNKGETDAIDGHLMLCRLKAAAALGILNGRLSINEEDWELSKTVLAMSTATRNGIEEHLHRVTKRSNEARAHFEADRVSIIEERSHVSKVERVVKVLERGVLAATEPLTWNQVSHFAASRDRRDKGLMQEVREVLLNDGKLVEDSGTYRAVNKLGHSAGTSGTRPLEGTSKPEMTTL